jgi:hypothetical protein
MHKMSSQQATPPKHKYQRTKFTDTKSRQVSKRAEVSAGFRLAGLSAGASGFESAEPAFQPVVPAVEPAGRFETGLPSSSSSANLCGKTAPKTSDSWGKRQNQAMGTTRNIDRSLTHEIHGSKPIETHQIERSVRKSNWGYFLGNFRIYGGNHKTKKNPWQPKAADTI